MEIFHVQDIVCSKDFPNRSFIVKNVDTMSQPIPLYTVIDMETREEFLSYCCGFELSCINPIKILREGKEIVHECATTLSKNLNILEVYIMNYENDLYYISIKNSSNNINTCKKLT